MSIQARLLKYPVPDSVWEEYRLDQEINDRGVGPVSYTHLDVYKRQMSDWSVPAMANEEDANNFRSTIVISVRCPSGKA